MIVGKPSKGEGEEEEEASQGLLPCLLSKAASNDKKFIVDAAAAALSVASARVPAELRAPRRLDSVRAKPSLPRGRAAAARALADVVGGKKSPSPSWAEPLFNQLSAVASELSRDAWPPARQAARDLAAALAKVERKEEQVERKEEQVERKKEEVERNEEAPPLLAAPVVPARSEQQGKENAAAASGAASAYATVTWAPAGPFSAAGKAMNVVVEAPEAAAAPQQTLGERGGGNGGGV